LRKSPRRTLRKGGTGLDNKTVSARRATRSAHNNRATAAFSDMSSTQGTARQAATTPTAADNERALRGGNFAAARAYAHGSRLHLPDALALLLLSLEEPGPNRDWYGRAAARWHARLVIELRGMDLTASQLALAAVAALPAARAVDAARTLTGLCETYDHDELVQLLEEWAERRERG
jgi:hypothetical protein